MWCYRWPPGPALTMPDITSHAIAERLTRTEFQALPPTTGPVIPFGPPMAGARAPARAILMNPRYTGVSVWGRQLRDEALVDVDDVAAGHRSLMHRNERIDGSDALTRHGLRPGDSPPPEWARHGALTDPPANAPTNALSDAPGGYGGFGSSAKS